MGEPPQTQRVYKFGADSYNCLKFLKNLVDNQLNIEVGKRIEVGNESGGWRIRKRIEVGNESILFSRNFSSAQVNPLQMENRYPPPVEEFPTAVGRRITGDSDSHRRTSKKDKARVCEWLAPDNAIFDVCWIKDDTNSLW
ncbi:hypothetical protein L2E82_15667 [Cichorium intybus]|uniref:Uncharacterized protein n=1 Tax=Cichorium intybus TaxID=13427 RepID=A0ACB9F4P6_CICIN|nr:hypothetical protein L2E82_15667 [Cichorium intybus]